MTAAQYHYKIISIFDEKSEEGFDYFQTLTHISKNRCIFVAVSSFKDKQKEQKHAQGTIIYQRTTTD